MSQTDTLFEPNTAAKLQKLSVLSRKLNKTQGVLDEELQRIAILQSIKPEPKPQLNPQNAAQIDRLTKQLARIELMMDKEKDTKELANLSLCHDRLFKAWCVLTATPSPGSRKIAADRPQRSRNQSNPEPTPAPTVEPQAIPNQVNDISPTIEPDDVAH